MLPLENYNAAILSIGEMVEFIRSEDNDSGGYNYLRGFVAYHKGRKSTNAQKRIAFVFTLGDKDLSGRIEQLASHLEIRPIEAVSAIMDEMNRQYRAYYEDSDAS